MEMVVKPKLIIHGGIFTDLAAFTQKRHLEEKFHEALVTTVKATFEVLCSIGARKAVVHGVRLLEDEPLFNAGTGSVVQADGQIRLSAGLIDSENQEFASVVNIQHVKNPIEVADLLAKHKFKNLAGEPATAFARQQGFPEYNPLIPLRWEEYEQKCLPAKRARETGTVGVVALDAKGIICAGTSTGGLGCETPGRVSDSPTVAGTYASSMAGVSCTGIGEHIINHAVATKIVTRVQDGMPLSLAVDKMLFEARKYEARFGLISLDAKGNFRVASTLTQFQVMYASYDGEILKVFP